MMPRKLGGLRGPRPQYGMAFFRGPAIRQRHYLSVPVSSGGCVCRWPAGGLKARCSVGFQQFRQQ